MSERQISAVHLVRAQEVLTNIDYQKAFSVSKRTASKELSELISFGVLVRHGTTGKGTYYTLKGQTRFQRGSKGAIKGQQGCKPIFLRSEERVMPPEEVAWQKR